MWEKSICLRRCFRFSLADFLLMRFHGKQLFLAFSSGFLHTQSDISEREQPFAGCRADIYFSASRPPALPQIGFWTHPKLLR